MIKELGYCPGIETIRAISTGVRRAVGPFCLVDYFPKDFLLIIDESHVTIHQIRGMFGVNSSRKNNLVDYGYRLPAALNKPTVEIQRIRIARKSGDLCERHAGRLRADQIGGFGGRTVHPPDRTGRSAGGGVRPTLNQIDDLVGDRNPRRSGRAGVGDDPDQTNGRRAL